MQRLIWVALAVVGALAGAVVLSAVASTFVDGWPPLPSGILVGLGALALAVGVPIAIARLGIGVLRSRGKQPPALPITAGLVVVANVTWVLLAHFLGPAPLPQLMPERGTWIADALSGRGPFGPAAIPVVERLATDARNTRSPDALTPLACDRTARALAMGIAGELEPSDGITRILERHGVEPGSALDALPEGVGRALLGDVLDVASGTIPIVDLPELPSADLTGITAERTRVRLASPGWEGRYEDGAWRVCLGEDGDALERGHTMVRVGKARARAEDPDAPVVPSWDAPVREALRNAVRGRTGFALGVPPGEEWSEAFTPTSAVVQARRILAWCAPAAAADPTHVARFDLLKQKWTVEDLSPEATARLEAEGRTFLRDVTATCAPVARDHVATELARGFPATVEDRARWVALEVASLDKAQVQELSILEVKAELPGASVRVVDDGGTWRVDWR